MSTESISISCFHNGSLNDSLCFPPSQVTIEVVDDPNMDLEMDLIKDWIPSSSVGWLGGKKLFWPLFWGYTDADSSEDGTGRSVPEETGEEEEVEEDYLLEYGSEKPLPSGRWNEGWDATQSYYGEAFFCSLSGTVSV
jgi:hypothetical protein